MLTKTECIVLKTQDYGESHKIVTMFSEKLGKFSAVARGAKKANSRLNAITQMFVHGEYLIYVTKGLSTIQQGNIIQSYRQIATDIVKTAYATYLVEMTEKMLHDRERDSFLYNELQLTLNWINERNDYIISVFMYELKMFTKGGFSPVLHHCVSCHQIQFPFYFSINEGGILCNKCRVKDEHAILLKNNVIKLLSILQQTPINRVGNVSVKKENIRIIRRLLDEYYDQYGGFYLKSKRFLSQINLLEE